MSIQIGDINLANEIIELHFQVLRTQMLLEIIVQNSSTTYKPNQSDVRDIEEKALKILNQKFPNMGIAKKTP
jgi:hypothetical protein